MENKYIIAGLVIVIVVLACIVGAMLLPSSNAQKDSKITITSNKTLYEGDNLTVKLTDLNNTPIENGVINVTISDKDGKVVAEESLTTNSKGKAKMNLDLDPGKYTVNATFGGNNNFTGNSTSKKITIEEVVEEPVQETSSAADQTDDNPVVDSREFESWDYAPGHHISEKTYANGDVERDIEGGYHSYYDNSEHREYYRNPDGSTGSMYVGN